MQSLSNGCNSRRGDLNAADYTEPYSSETQRHEYEPLKASSVVINAVSDVDEYAYPVLTDETRTSARMRSGLYADVQHIDQNTVSPESTDNRSTTNTADTSFPLAYENLQRPVKALNFNTCNLKPGL